MNDNNKLLTGDNAIEYAVLVEGVTVYRSSNKLVAENYRNNLPESDRLKASVIPLTNTGKQVLLG